MIRSEKEDTLVLDLARLALLPVVFAIAIIVVLLVLKNKALERRLDRELNELVDVTVAMLGESYVEHPVAAVYATAILVKRFTLDVDTQAVLLSKFLSKMGLKNETEGRVIKVTYDDRRFSIDVDKANALDYDESLVNKFVRVD